MMRHRLYILSMTVATLVLMAFTIMPHHHHEGRICIVFENCDGGCEHDDDYSHGCDNDGCSHNHTDCNGSACDDICVTKSNYFTSETKKITPKVLVCDDFQEYYILAEIFTRNAKTVNRQPSYGEYVVPLYQSANVSRCNGLRAPPFQA